MDKIHWNYFLAIEQDLLNLSRYIEFCEDNMKTYSLEIARILIASTQEIDVLLKQLCLRNGDNSSTEKGYMAFFQKKFPKMLDLKVEIPRFGLEFTPFKDWQKNNTPKWWTANNKVKHHRNDHFSDSNIENVINSVCALYITNLYFSDGVSDNYLEPVNSIITCEEIMGRVSPSAFGFIPHYELPNENT